MQSTQTTEAGAQTPITVKPFQIRGRFITAVAMRLTGDADEAFYEALDAQLRQTPHFFVNAPFVIDLEQAQSLSSHRDVARLVEEMRRRRLSVFGVQNGTETQVAAARDAGLISLAGGGGRDVPMERVERANQPAAPEAAATPAPPATLTITEPVRSGQTIFADRGDLVVVASVGSGAELVAAGNIHVYGQLRGRALAGVNGDETARIFCQSLDAELIAIAGLYRTNEDLDATVRKQRVQAFLKDETLCLEALK